MNEALKAAGSTMTQYTEYDQNEQVQLDGVWAKPEVLKWFLEQRQSQPKRASADPLSSAPDLIGMARGNDRPNGSADGTDEDYDPDDANPVLLAFAERLLLQANAHGIEKSKTADSAPE